MRRTALLLASTAFALLLTCGVVLVGVKEPAEATMPGENGKIAFWSNRDGTHKTYTMNADGSGVTRLTDNLANNVGGAVWSPDGTKIAFVSGRDGNPEIYTMNADGSGVTRLTNYVHGDFSPTWSPDGTKIAFIGQREPRDSNDFREGDLGYQEIYTMNTDGSDVTRLTNFNPEEHPEYPIGWRLTKVTWSPDGSKMAFTRESDCVDCLVDIFTMNANGSDKRYIATGEDPSWSPDGTKLSYSYPRSSYEDNDIYSMNADGSDKTNLTNTGGSSGGINGSVWAPNGSLIAFSVGAEGIYTMAPDGTNQTRLTDGVAYSFEGGWQPLPSTYAFSGFFSPVDNLPTVNKAKAGSAIPVKFSLGGDQGLDIFAQDADGSSFPKSGTMACDSTDPVDAIEQTVSAGSSGLTYDAATDSYTYVWKTQKAWTGCRQLVVKLNDGKDYRANFKLVK